MEHDIYEMTHSMPVEKVLKELREIVASKSGAGITIMGNRVTIRWGSPLKEIHMVILSVDDGSKCGWCKENHNKDFYCEAQAEAEAQ